MRPPCCQQLQQLQCNIQNHPHLQTVTTMSSSWRRDTTSHLLPAEPLTWAATPELWEHGTRCQRHHHTHFVKGRGARGRNAFAGTQLRYVTKPPKAKALPGTYTSVTAHEVKPCLSTQTVKQWAAMSISFICGSAV